MKTKFASACSSDVCRGCKFCVRGEKLVLFVGGKCSRNCWYCSLSCNRKNREQVFANERPCKNVKDVLIEAVESNAKGAGITGGDPLVYFSKTLKFAKALKKKFGKSFHIHIYLPLVLVDEKKLRKLHKWIDEVRFHPSFLINSDEKLRSQEMEKIKTASEIFGKENTGVELPMLPEKKKEIYNFLEEMKKYIGFMNLNEFELSETNFNVVTKKYSLNEDTYTIRGSRDSAKWILSKVAKNKIKVKVHFCTAQTKDCYQYINRLRKHNIMPFGNMTDEGTVVYFAIYDDNLKKAEEKLKKLTKNYFVDKIGKRILVKMNDVLKVYEKSDLKIARVEEAPSFDKERFEFSWIGSN